MCLKNGTLPEAGLKYQSAVPSLSLAGRWSAVLKGRRKVYSAKTLPGLACWLRYAGFWRKPRGLLPQLFLLGRMLGNVI